MTAPRGTAPRGTAPKGIAPGGVGAAGIRGLLADAAFRRTWLIGLCGGVARWLEMLVVGIFAFETTGSPFLVALLVILRMAPLAAFGAVVGTFADRLSPRRFLLAGLSLATMVSILLFALFAFELARYWHVALATFASGLIWTTDMPLRRRLLGDAAGPSRLAQAMSFDSASNNATRMLGPLVGGLLYQALGAAGAFACAALLYGLCVLMVVALPKPTPAEGPAKPAVRFFQDFKEAFRFAARDRDLLRILLVTVVFNLWGFPFVSMIPVIGREDFGLSAGWIGGLSALEGCGAFLGALVIAFSVRGTPSRRIYYFGTMAFLCFIFIAGWMPSAGLTAAVFVCVGLAGACFTTMQSTLVYAVAPPEMRGRLFGLLVICIGTGLIGFTNIGLMAEWYGGSAAIRIVAAEGLIPLLLIGLGWRQLWRGR